MQTQDLTAKEKALEFETRPFIGGNFVAPASDATFETENPATARKLVEFPDCDEADVDAAVAAARKAFDSGWRLMAPAARKAVLLEFSRHIGEEAEDLALLDSLEMGKPIAMALGEMELAAAFTQFYAELADKIYGETAPADPDEALSMTIPEPCGVVGVITPWNFPVATAATALAPALAAGNSVVLKPSEHSPSSALRLAEIAMRAGLPEGVFNVVPGRGPSAGAALARHVDVDKLHFTGSTAVGRQLMVYAGQSNGKPVMLETGGKSPQIVFADAADIEGIGAALAAATFANSGQVCVARTRLIVERSVRDAIVQAITQEAGSVFSIGDPLSLDASFGPISSRKQYERVENYLQVGREEGAEEIDVPLGGESCDEGYFVTPRIFACASPDWRIAQEEIFGPVMSMLTFDDEAEALALANRTQYGLAATVWTLDLARGRRFARDLVAGRVDIRSTGEGIGAFIQLTAEPFGGSGHGPIGGIQGLDPYLRRKAIQFITA